MFSDCLDRLSKINTLWPLVRQSQEPDNAQARAAQEQLVRRYSPAVRRYLLSALHDVHAADDLTQEFAVLLISGAFHKADAERGRFRSYIKSVLFHLVSTWRRKRQTTAAELPDCAAPDEDLDAEFNQTCRAELLCRTWDALAEANDVYHKVLRFRADHQEQSSTELALGLGRRLGRAVAPTWVRQTLHRARELYADLLLKEVAKTLAEPTPEQIEEELCELDLLKYCQAALDRRN